MGTYTKFQFDATLRQNTPEDCLAYLRRRLGADRTVDLDDVPYDTHPFFTLDRWDWILTWYNCNGNGHKTWCKDTDQGLRIHIDTSLKNYTYDIEWFLLWIAPLVNLEHECTAYAQIEYEDPYMEGDCKDLIRKIQQRVFLSPLSLGDNACALLASLG